MGITVFAIYGFAVLTFTNNFFQNMFLASHGFSLLAAFLSWQHLTVFWSFSEVNVVFCCHNNVLLTSTFLIVQQNESNLQIWTGWWCGHDSFSASHLNTLCSSYLSCSMLHLAGDTTRFIRLNTVLILMILVEANIMAKE